MNRELGETRLLEGVRVIDFTFQGAGPYASLIVALLGADVIKVESSLKPDPTRGRDNRPYAHSLLFDDVNVNKRSLRLNMKNPRGVDLARQLIGNSDVVMANFRPGVMDRWGLTFESLSKDNPRLVMAAMSATGNRSPLAGLPGYAGIFNAMGGLGELTGYEDGTATELRTSIDMRVGAMFAAATVLGLLSARLTGKGSQVDVSAIDTVASLVGEHLAYFAVHGEVPGRIGNGSTTMAPHGIHPSLNGEWVFVAARNDDEWRKLCEAIGCPGMAKEERFATVEGRRQGRDEIDAAISAWTVQQEMYAAFHALQRAGVTSAPVLDAQNLLNDEHLQARGVYSTILAADQRDEGRDVKREVFGAPWAVDGARPRIMDAPLLGSSSAEILKELCGLSEVDVQALEADQVLY